MTQQLIETRVNVIAVVPDIRNKFDFNGELCQLILQCLLKAAFRMRSVK